MQKYLEIDCFNIYTPCNECFVDYFEKQILRSPITAQVLLQNYHDHITDLKMSIIILQKGN